MLICIHTKEKKNLIPKTLSTPNSLLKFKWDAVINLAASFVVLVIIKLKMYSYNLM
jgi:hypothetical protein